MKKKGSKTVLDSLEKMSGIPKGEIKTIWDKVLVNSKMLDECSAPHDFYPTGQRKVADRYRCSKCSGEVDFLAYSWYAKGLKHGANS